MKSKSKRTIPSLTGETAVVLLLCLLAPFTNARAQPNLEDFVQQSTIIFQGTVTALREVTMPIVPVSDNTIIVKVDELLEAPQLLSTLTGQEITVLAQDTTALEIGEQAIFFTKGWLWGESIAVEEVGRLREADLTELRRQIAAVRQDIAYQDLEERIVMADLVVVGNIAEVRVPTEPGEPRPITEHDPQWREATLDIEEVLKGDASLESVALLFPGTLDVAWADAPKFSADQEGIWILQKDEQREVYTALNPLDFQTKDQLDRIRDIIERTGNTPRR